MTFGLRSRSVRFAWLGAAALLGLAACDKPQALGDANAVIVGVADEAWPAVSDEIEAALEPRAFTVRDERIFRVTQVDPRGPYWGDTRRFRQVLLIGEPGDEWIAQALREAGHQPTQLPAVVETQNVWARGQRVIAVVLPPGAEAAAAREVIHSVGESMLQDYQTFVRQRMFASGADTARAVSLLQQEGFSVVTPAVYRHEQPEPNTHLFINDQPDPAQLQRVVLVTSRPTAEVSLTADAALAWREDVAQRYYHPPQLTDRERTERAVAGAQSSDGVQVQGVWSSPPGAWPAAGPFLTRVHTCPDGRSFLIDAWVYAPGREKYEYMFQLNTILDSFRCGAQGAG
jgi:hypothetical protein